MSHSSSREWKWRGWAHTRSKSIQNWTRLRCFSEGNRLLEIFHQSVVARALFIAAVCWGDGIGGRTEACTLTPHTL